MGILFKTSTMTTDKQIVSINQEEDVGIQPPKEIKSIKDYLQYALWKEKVTDRTIKILVSKEWKDSVDKLLRD